MQPSLGDGGAEAVAARAEWIDRHGIGTAPALMPEGTTDENMATGCMFWATPVASQPSLRGVDVSEFDGVSFWARRGPSGQATLRIALVDDSTSSERALVEDVKNDLDPGTGHPQCTRVVECCRYCDEDIEYQYVDSGLNDPNNLDAGTGKLYIGTSKVPRCHLENEPYPEFRYETDADGGEIVVAVDPDCSQASACDAGDACETRDQAAVTRIWEDWNTDFSRCCPKTREEDGIDYDPVYGGKPCRPYVFNFDYSSGSYCHSEDQVLPERNQNRCGESFESSVVVGTEWKLYRIPWRELRRFTPDKPAFNPKGVWQISFYWGQGYLDTYVDDIGFYKERH